MHVLILDKIKSTALQKKMPWCLVYLCIYFPVFRLWILSTGINLSGFMFL